MRDLQIASRAVVFAPWTTLLACTGMAVTDVVLSAVTPGYDAVGDTSSQLMSSGEPYSSLARAVLGLYSVLLMPLAVVMWREVGHHRIAGVAIAAGMWTHIAASLTGAAAQNDSDVTVIGGLSANTLHDQSAIIMFAAAVVVLAAVVSVRGGCKSGSRLVNGILVRTLTWSSFTVVLVTGTLFMLEIWTQWNGVVERTSAGMFMLWMVVFAMSLRSERGRAAAGVE